MKLETFFEKFDQFADAPNAVAKMRELVRHMAVTGKLVDQDDTDEPASTLLDRIAANKTALAKEGKLRGPITVVPMSPDEGSRVLPSSWTWVRFGEIMVNRDGERKPVSRADRETKAKTYDYYGASGIIDKIDGFLFDKPLLLIGEDGANLINRSTPIAFIARGKYWVNNHAHVLDGISENFLRFIELHINAINLEKYITGSAQPKMNQAKMNSIPVSLPPLAEQKRIVAKVDELMALCDRLEAQQQERDTRRSALARASLARFAEAPTPANLHHLFHPSYTIPPADLRKSILTLAVQGKLVPQDPNDGDSQSEVDQLLAWKIKNGRKSLNLNKEKLSGEHPIPTSWRWITAKNSLRYKQGLQVPKEKQLRDPKDGWVRYLRIIDFRHDNDQRFIENTQQDVYCEPDDIIMVRYGSAGEIVGGKIGVYHNNMFRIDFDDSALFPEYLKIYLRTESVRASLLGRSTSITMSQVNHTSVDKLKIPLPPLAEQRRIVAKVDQLMALVDELETQLAASRATAKNLLQALVAELTSKHRHPIGGKIAAEIAVSTEI
jgi:type I restriction enzyme S subunit